jgi:hypothetical protein
MWPPYIARRYLFLLSAPGKNRGGPPGAGFGVGKGTIGMGRTSSPGVLRLRAPSAVSCDESVRRFAQDDDFVGVLKKKIPSVSAYGTMPRIVSVLYTFFTIFFISWNE